MILILGPCYAVTTAHGVENLGSETMPIPLEPKAEEVSGEVQAPLSDHEDSASLEETADLQGINLQEQADHDDDEDDDEDEDEDEDQEEIQLGFAEEMERDDDGLIALEARNWRDWDGGKVGGKPVGTEIHSALLREEKSTL